MNSGGQRIKVDPFRTTHLVAPPRVRHSCRVSARATCPSGRWGSTGSSRRSTQMVERSSNASVGMTMRLCSDQICLLFDQRNSDLTPTAHFGSKYRSCAEQDCAPKIPCDKVLAALYRGWHVSWVTKNLALAKAQELRTYRSLLHTSRRLTTYDTRTKVEKPTCWEYCRRAGHVIRLCQPTIGPCLGS